MKTAIMTTIATLLIGSMAAAQQFQWEEKPPGYKSPSRAVMYSLAATLVPAGIGLVAATTGGDGYFAGAMIGTGIAFGPTAGYVYGNASSRGIKRALGRTIVGGAFLALGYSAGLQSEGLAPPPGSLFIVIGSAVVGILVIYDIAVVDNYVRKHNEKIIGKEQARIMVAPHYFADSGAAGLQLQMNF